MKINEMKVLRFNLFKLIGQIDESWDGDASRSYIKRLESYLVKIDNMINILSAYADYLKKSASDLEKLDIIWKTVSDTMLEMIQSVGKMQISN